MKTTPAPGARVRFGTFEADLRSGELYRAGLRVRIQELPFQVLIVLLENPGKVVRREDLHKKLWPADTFVDFEQGLNKAINRLREALGDDANNPRYVETLPRRGYRFIGPLEEGTASSNSRPSAVRAIGFTSVVVAAVLAALLALNVAGLRSRLLGHSTGPPKIHSIAVLPLENLSGDPQQEYFAEGMTEELITTLGKISALRVISRTSVMQYKGTQKPLPEIARELNVDAIVEGTVERSGNHVRITANLLYAPADQHLWAQTYERNLGDVLSLQDDVARDIASQIKIKLTPKERTRLATRRPVNPEAHRLYLLSRYSLYREPGGPEKSVGYARQAIEKHPDYALAYAGLGGTYNLMGDNGQLPYSEAYSKAKAAAARALELDETLPQAHAALATALMYLDWDWAGAEREYKRAIELNPNAADAHDGYGFYLVKMGRVEEGIAQLKRAAELDPLQPGRYSDLAFAYYADGKYDQGLKAGQKYLELAPNSGPLWFTAVLHVEMGKYKEAILEFKKMAGSSHALPHILGHLGNTYARAGMTAEARNCLRELKEDLKKDDGVGTYEVALIYAGLEEKDQAFEWLDKAYEQHDKGMTYLKIDPPLAPLRSDPRFQALLRRMNFPK